MSFHRLRRLAGLIILLSAWAMLGVAGAQEPDPEVNARSLRIEQLKQELASTNRVVAELESYLPRIDKMAAENRQLAREIEALQAPAYRRAKECYAAGSLAYAKRNYARAIEKFGACLGVGGPMAVAALNNRGVAHLASGQAQKALADFDRALAQGGTPIVRYNRGMAHQALGHTAQAQKDFAEAARTQH